MEGFPGAWPSRSHSPMATNACDDGLVALFQEAHPTSEFTDAEWPMFGSFEQENPTPGAEFDLSEFTAATQVATHNAMSSITDLPFSQPHSAPSSNASSTIAPQQSAAGPILTWPPVTAPPMLFGLPFVDGEHWTSEQMYQPSNNGPAGRESMGIYVPQAPQPCVIHPNSHFNYVFDQGSPNEYEDHSRHYMEGRGYRPEQKGAFTDDPNDDGEDDDDCHNSVADPCYAQLLYKCLKEAPEHMMTLQELYEWVALHTQKAKDPKSVGWKNSVRHNLSMNAVSDSLLDVTILSDCANTGEAFERTQAHGPKKGCFWRLTERALREGVISTTRYRKDPKRKSTRRGAPSVKRQYSGARGGQATRAATRRNRDLEQTRSAHHFPAIGHSHMRGLDAGFMTPHSMCASPSPHPNTSPLHASTSPYFRALEHESPMPQQALSNSHTPPQLQLFYDHSTKPLLSAFEFPRTDYANGRLFGDGDDGTRPETPSLVTEASPFTDDEMQALLPHYPDSATEIC